MRWLALDFDGVISDSAPESFAVALQTRVELDPGSRLAADLRRIAPDGRFELARVRADPLYAAFVEAMPLGNRAEDFGAVLCALEAGHALPDQAAYDRWRAHLGEGFLERFHERFYARRHAWAAARPAEWSALLAPYPDFVALLRRRAGDVGLAIATAKDRESVARLLRDYGLADLFPADRVLDKETGVHKRAHLQILAERFAIPFGSITFVDDKVNHLERVADLGVRCALAAWGYNGERERRIARARGFLVCDLAHAEAQLFDPDR